VAYEMASIPTTLSDHKGYFLLFESFVTTIPRNM